MFRVRWTLFIRYPRGFEDGCCLRVTVAAADVGIFYLDLVLRADGVNLDAAHKPQPAADDAGFQHHVGAGIGVKDVWHRAVGA
ncbi:MAG: hypothetical protein DRI48_03830 [Chloroflexi bacterium]|nr:MAG: hypothetical protein DRI48_03830 [Chloroflexota bacterium]